MAFGLLSNMYYKYLCVLVMNRVLIEGDIRRPYPTDMDMRAGFLGGRLGDQPNAQNTGFPDSRGAMGEYLYWRISISVYVFE